MNEIQPRALNVTRELPTYLNCTQRQADMAVRSGELPHIRLGHARLVRVEAADAWLKSREQRGISAAESRRFAERFKGAKGGRRAPKARAT